MSLTVLPTAPADHDRLLALLRAPQPRIGAFSLATRETLAVARELEPRTAGDALAAVLSEYRPGADSSAAERAAHVVHELRLVDALPALSACVARLPEGDRVASLAYAALGLSGSAIRSSPPG